MFNTLRQTVVNGYMTPSTRRYLSDTTRKGRRFLRTIPSNIEASQPFMPLNYSIDSTIEPVSGNKGWAKHSLTSLSDSTNPFVRKSRAQKYSSNDSTAPVEQSTTPSSPSTTATVPSGNPHLAKRKAKRSLRPRKALITLSPTAVSHLQGLLDQPEPKLIRIGVKNRGCSGLSYNLEYVTEAGKFDELIEQDGVKVFIDSKAIFSIVGSEMDWVDDKLSSKFVFKNPNSKGTCGCGESFMV